MKRSLATFMVALIGALLIACAQIGIPAADTFNKKAIAAHSMVAGIAKSASMLRAAGKLSDADRDNVVASLKAAESAIDLATTTHKTDAAGGMTKLDASVAILGALNAYLLTKEK